MPSVDSHGHEPGTGKWNCLTIIGTRPVHQGQPAVRYPAQTAERPKRSGAWSPSAGTIVSFGRLQSLLHEDLFGLCPKNLDPVIDDGLRDAGDLVALDEVWKFRGFDHCRANQRTGGREPISQADRLGTKCSGRGDKDLALDRPVEGC